MVVALQFRLLVDYHMLRTRWRLLMRSGSYSLWQTTTKGDGDGVPDLPSGGQNYHFGGD
jgi:hypothetical protein